MVISKLNYEQLFPNPYVQFGNIRLWMEVNLEEGETIADGYTKAHKEVNENFNRLFPQVTYAIDESVSHETKHAEPSIFPITQAKPQKSRVEVLAHNIELVKTIEELNSWKLLVSKNPELQQAFDKKMEELSK